MRFLAWRTVVPRGALIAPEPLILAGRPLIAPKPLVLAWRALVTREPLVLPWGPLVARKPLVLAWWAAVAAESLLLTWRMTVAPRRSVALTWRATVLTWRTTVVPRRWRPIVLTGRPTVFTLAWIAWSLAFLPSLELLFSPAHIPRFLGVFERLPRVAMTSARPPGRTPTRLIGAPLATFFSRALGFLLRLPQSAAREVFQHRIRMFLQDALERRQ
jgi:hypothetical protein